VLGACTRCTVKGLVQQVAAVLEATQGVGRVYRVQTQVPGLPATIPSGQQPSVVRAARPADTSIQGACVAVYVAWPHTAGTRAAALPANCRLKQPLCGVPAFLVTCTPRSTKCVVKRLEQRLVVVREPVQAVYNGCPDTDKRFRRHHPPPRPSSCLNPSIACQLRSPLHLLWQLQLLQCQVLGSMSGTPGM